MERFFSVPRGVCVWGVVRCMLPQSAGALAWYVFSHHFASPVFDGFHGGMLLTVASIISKWSQRLSLAKDLWE